MRFQKETKETDNKEFKEYFDQLDNEYQQPRRESKHEKVMRMQDNTNEVTPDGEDENGAINLEEDYDL